MKKVPNWVHRGTKLGTKRYQSGYSVKNEVPTRALFAGVSQDCNISDIPDMKRDWDCFPQRSASHV